jgi:hypothetical protein
MVSQGVMNRPVTDQLGVKRPSLCSTDGPSLRPDLPTPGALERVAVKHGPRGHRSSRRAASLRAARCKARLWKGEDFSDGLSGGSLSSG